MINYLKDILKKKAANEDVLVSPGEYTLIAEALTVTVDDHDLLLEPKKSVPDPNSRIPDNRCRSYLTQGLVAHGQREVMFVLATRDKTASVKHEKDIFNLLSFIYNRAVEGEIVNPGNYTTFKDPAPFGVPYCGIAYLEAIDGPGPLVPEGALLAVFLHPDECAVVINAGSYRVAAWLAYSYRIFPYPKFSDPSRLSVIPPHLADSMLARVPTMKATGTVYALLQDNILTVSFTEDSLNNLSNTFDVAKKNNCFGIATGHVTKADSRLVWLPNRENPEAVSCLESNSSILEGGFVIFLGEQEKDSGMIVDDGFSVMLSHKSWYFLIECIRTGANFDIPMKGEENRFIKHLYVVNDKRK